MPRIILKEKITKEIEIPMDTLFEVIDNLTEEERAKLLQRLKTKPVTKQIKLRPYKSGKIGSILADFTATDLYEEDFLKDLEEGLKKSSVYQ